MALTTVPLPYGLRKVVITPYTDGSALTLGTPIQLLYSQKFTFTSSEDTEEMRGDDKLIAVQGKGEVVAWELEAGGLSFEATQAIFGGTLATTGTTPNQIKTWKKLFSDSRNYFKVEGQAISGSIGDVHCTVWKCKAAGDFKGELADGKFWTSGVKGTSLPATLASNVDEIYRFVHNETVTAIV
jgi:hypothetical protein